MAKRGVCGLAHEAKAAPAIDKPDTVLGQDAAEVARGLGKGGIAARARTAIDANVPDARREGDVIHKGSCGIRFRHASRKAPFQSGWQELV